MLFKSTAAAAASCSIVLIPQKNGAPIVVIAG